MRLFSYVVARDYGFAPNPFFGFCTLATCKPRIRQHASVGDWVVGTAGSRSLRPGSLVYAMQVTEAMTLDEYWRDERFLEKRPNLRGSEKQAFGDNIYSLGPDTGEWRQVDSHHSYESGAPNPHNLKHDTQTDRVLISEDFTYWGGAGPNLPEELSQCCGFTIRAGQGHKSRFPSCVVESFAEWYRSTASPGYLAAPGKWT